MPGLSKKSVLIAGLAALLLLPFQNCGLRLNGMTGTETGNAMSPDKHNPSSGQMLAARQLVAQLCASAVSCQTSLDQATCESKVATADGLAQKFGVPSSSGITTLQALADAEAQGTYRPSPAATSTCTNEISAVPCGALPMLGNSSSPGEFAGTVDSVVSQTPDCSQVYK